METRPLLYPIEAPLRHEAILLPSINYVVVLGKGLDVVTDPNTNRDRVVPKEATYLAGAAAGVAYRETRRMRPAQPLTVMCSGGPVIPEARRDNITEADFLADAVVELGGVPRNNIDKDKEAIDTQMNVERIGAKQRNKGTVSGVALIIGRDHGEQMHLFEKHGIMPEQILFIEDVLSHEPGFEDRIAERRRILQTPQARAGKFLRDRAYEIRLGRAFLRLITSYTRTGTAPGAPIALGELEPSR